MDDLKLEKMAAAFLKLRPRLRVVPGRYDSGWGFIPDPGTFVGLGEDDVREFNQNHIRQIKAPRKYLIWAPHLKNLKHPTFEEFMESYNGKG